MNPISLGLYGTLRFCQDHWICEDSPTPIGTVDVQVDTGMDISDQSADHVIAAMDRIEEIHSEAQAYLRQQAPKDFARAHPLRAPSLLISPGDPAGAFTMFYSGADDDDQMCYGVVFREFSPFDLTIGD